MTVQSPDSASVDAGQTPDAQRHSPAFEPPVASTWHHYGQRLVSAGKLSERDLDRALAAQREMGGPLDRVLVSLGLVSEVDAAKALAAHLALPFVASDGLPEAVAEVEGLLPEFLRAHNVLPSRTADGQLAVIMAAPQDPVVIKALRLTTGLDVQPRVGVASDIE